MTGQLLICNCSSFLTIDYQIWNWNGVLTIITRNSNIGRCTLPDGLLFSSTDSRLVMKPLGGCFQLSIRLGNVSAVFTNKPTWRKFIFSRRISCHNHFNCVYLFKYHSELLLLDSFFWHRADINVKAWGRPNSYQGPWSNFSEFLSWKMGNSSARNVEPQNL